MVGRNLGFQLELVLIVFLMNYEVTKRKAELNQMDWIVAEQFALLVNLEQS